MADINGVTLNAGSSPTVHYTITYSKSRPNNSQMTYNFTISAALGSSGSFIHSGYALLCTVTVNGASSQVRIKAADGDDWDGTAPRYRYVSVTCASTSGNTEQGVRFRVVSDGRLTLTSGVIDNSSYTVLSASLLTTACGAPTACSVSPILAEGGVTLSWSGAVPGTSAIEQYVIQRATSTDGVSWSAYEALATIISSATSGTYEANASPIAGTYTRYRISVTDVLDAVSAYVVSGSVKKNSPPAEPVIVCPKNGSSIYNTTPRFLITTGIEPDGQTQIVEVKIDSGAWRNSVDNPEMFSTSGYLGNGVNTIYQAAALAAGNHTATIRCLDSDIESASPEVVRTFVVMPSPFEEITANVTHVRTAHIQALRTAVNATRNYHHLPPVAWSEEIVAGKTVVKNWPFHVTELRKAIEPIITMINDFDASSIFDIPSITWLPIGAGRPKANVMLQLQDLMLTL